MGADNFSDNKYLCLQVETNQANRDILKDVMYAINDSDLYWIATEIEYGYHEDIRLQIDKKTIPVWERDVELPAGQGRVWGVGDWELCDPMTGEEFDAELTRQIRSVELAIEVAMLQFGQSARQFVLLSEDKTFTKHLMDGGETSASYSRAKERAEKHTRDGVTDTIKIMQKTDAWDIYPDLFAN